MQLLIDNSGGVQLLYTERLDLSPLGPATIRRASHVEPGADGWTADMSPIGGPVLGPYPPDQRSAALAAEVDWINANTL